MKRFVCLFLVLCLMTPVLSLADTRTDAAAAIAGADGLPGPIANVLTSLSWETYDQPGEHGFTLYHDGRRLFSVAAASDEDAWYLSTSLWQGTIALRSDALLPTLARIAEGLGALDVISTDAALAVSGFLGRAEPKPKTADDPDFHLSKIDWSALEDMMNLLSLTPEVIHGVYPEEQSFRPYDCDTCYTWTITPGQANYAITSLVAFLNENARELSKLPYLGKAIRPLRMYGSYHTFRARSKDLLSADAALSVYVASETGGIAIAELRCPVAADQGMQVFSAVYTCLEDDDLTAHQLHVSWQEDIMTFELQVSQETAGTHETFSVRHNGDAALEMNIRRRVSESMESIRDHEVLRIDLLDGDALVAWLESAVTDVRAWWQGVKERIPPDLFDSLTLPW